MAVAVAVAVSGGVAVPVAGLTKGFFNQKDFLINVWGYVTFDFDSCDLNSQVSSGSGRKTLQDHKNSARARIQKSSTGDFLANSV